MAQLKVMRLFLLLSFLALLCFTYPVQGASHKHKHKKEVDEEDDDIVGYVPYDDSNFIGGQTHVDSGPAGTSQMDDCGLCYKSHKKELNSYKKKIKKEQRKLKSLKKEISYLYAFKAAIIALDPTSPAFKPPEKNKGDQKKEDGTDGGKPKDDGTDDGKPKDAGAADMNGTQATDATTTGGAGAAAKPETTETAGTPKVEEKPAGA